MDKKEMKVVFSDGDLKIDIKLNGFSEEIKYDVLHYLQDAVDREKGLQAKKVKNLELSFLEGYNQLPNFTEGGASEYEKGLKEYADETDTPDPKTFGVKIIDGEERYQCFYICTDCPHKGKRFVRRGEKYTFCHECNKRLAVDTATENGFPEQDRYRNFYIAGAFERDFNPEYQYVN